MQINGKILVFLTMKRSAYWQEGKGQEVKGVDPLAAMGG